jgi:hypothetical protein
MGLGTDDRIVFDRRGTKLKMREPKTRAFQNQTSNSKVLDLDPKGFEKKVIVDRVRRPGAPRYVVPSRWPTSLTRRERIGHPVLHQGTVGSVIVWFCGQRYSAIYIDVWKSLPEDRSFGETERRIYWDPEKLKRDLECWDGISVVFKDSTSKWGNDDDRPGAISLMADRGSQADKARVRSLEIVTATLVSPLEDWSRKDLEWDVNADTLGSVQFAKVFDPFQAYQEIEMYVGGVLSGRENSMATVSDEVRAQKHGMDKTSFRKMGHQSKPRRK